MGLKTLFEAISIGDVTGVAFLFLSAVQISPIKFNPWTWLARWFGKSINGDVIKRQDALEKKVDGIHAELDDLRDREERKAADDARNRILRFADELRLHMKHSKEFFENILEDIDFYMGYCRCNDSYPNSKADAAIKFILEVYEQLVKENDFI